MKVPIWFTNYVYCKSLSLVFQYPWVSFYYYFLFVVVECFLSIKL